MKDKLKKLSISLPATVAVVGTTVAHATEGSDAVADALTATAGQITGTITAVAPIALGIFGTFMVWKYGKKFFKSLLG
ncbi:MAG: hypothetical protein AB2417_20095 [Clostridiaceae bacterium]